MLVYVQLADYDDRRRPFYFVVWLGFEEGMNDDGKHPEFEICCSVLCI
jgi:hypothetical protein